ncbi:subpellicular microtubule protein 2, putative (SPM2) [Plasmodium ovale wallikeri]|uniref:Subpellicular microtubule protein 2, putative (SPM2) n=1 Tax=Plasmodium ovale wallikeri TaxID=864142 RepID=A0A1A9A054_PLAOA|nr:subpellicular microtubule protein 2, putative (SPM2) [Plasmodium ovale wallikeri]
MNISGDPQKLTHFFFYQMAYPTYAGLSSERLDSLRNLDIRKKSVFNGSQFSCGNGIYEILHNCPSEKKKTEDEKIKRNSKHPVRSMHYAGLQSDIKNDIDLRNRRIKSDINNHGDILKDIIQNNVNEEMELNGSKYFLSDKGFVLTPKRSLARHVDDSEIQKYFSTKYAVTDKISGRTEIMVERKPGCSNIIVQNFSEFDAYATYRRQDARKSKRDSFVHTKMVKLGIVPKDGSPTGNKNCKAQAIFTDVHRSDNIAPDNYWLCPTVESENKKRAKY